MLWRKNPKKTLSLWGWKLWWKSPWFLMAQDVWSQSTKECSSNSALTWHIWQIGSPVLHQWALPSVWMFPLRTLDSALLPPLFPSFSSLSLFRSLMLEMKRRGIFQPFKDSNKVSGFWDDMKVCKPAPDWGICELAGFWFHKATTVSSFICCRENIGAL